MTIVIKGLTYNEVYQLVNDAGYTEEDDDIYIDDFGLADAPRDNRPMVEIDISGTSFETEEGLVELFEEVEGDYSEDEVEIDFL
tara:strand:+ start:15233 stop:15484 length:252 start_codon:yes stop_codon:yes gene_type:complete